MGKTVISEFVSLDGVIEDPAGDEGFRHGGWIGEVGGRLVDTRTVGDGIAFRSYEPALDA
jgi:hypothetical protein